MEVMCMYAKLYMNIMFGVSESVDKLYKLHPSIDAILDKLHCIKMDERLSVDEQITPFKEKHSMKVYIQKNQRSGDICFMMCDDKVIL